MSEDIKNKVIEIVKEHLDVNDKKIELDTNLFNDLDADSLDAVELIMAFEEEFGIEISEKDAEKITTIKEAVDYIETHKK